MQGLLPVSRFAMGRGARLASVWSLLASQLRDLQSSSVSDAFQQPRGYQLSFTHPFPGPSRASTFFLGAHVSPSLSPFQLALSASPEPGPSLVPASHASPWPCLCPGGILLPLAPHAVVSPPPCTHVCHAHVSVCGCSLPGMILKLAGKKKKIIRKSRSAGLVRPYPAVS